MDDLDDLLDEASPIKEVSSKLSKLDLKQPANNTESWDEMDLKVIKQKASTVDEWGDLKTEQKDPVIAAKKPAPPKQEPEEDDWGTYETPVIKKNSEKVKQIATKRKEEDEEDDWGDVIEAKADTKGGYYDCTTGT